VFETGDIEMNEGINGNTENPEQHNQGRDNETQTQQRGRQAAIGYGADIVVKRIVGKASLHRFAILRID